MKIIIICALACLIAFFNFARSFAQENDIKKQSVQLSDVKKNIKRKQLERDRLAMQEKVFKRELSVLNAAIEKNENNLEKLALEIKTAERNLASASQEYGRAFRENNELNRIILDELEAYNKMTFSFSYAADPVEYKIRQEALKNKKSAFDAWQNAVETSSADIKKWRSAKEKLLNLRKKENSLFAERKGLLKEKQELLDGTSGRRAAAEAEIKALNESAKALQILIKKLSQESKKKEKGTVIRSKDSQIKRKKSLPWPVSGKVILKFGKNKHPELDAYVISNGIKIKTGDSSAVCSVDSGVAVFVGEFRSYGKVVIIDHKDRYFSVYGQLAQFLVAEDQKVSKGTPIARTGKGSDAVLYFEIRQDNIPDDPLLWLKADAK
ncbi:MAG: peptidoglycan DD-metalloendopeptidase family protein [Endomicrobium sp.]|jgi:septal ring factor EnvC (AmiA/AmiB activator)|nr:peptidoglycan DD-metalloendopeptidase family protein [Endomicrobium sp.]